MIRLQITGLVTKGLLFHPTVLFVFVDVCEAEETFFLHSFFFVLSVCVIVYRFVNPPMFFLI